MLGKDINGNTNIITLIFYFNLIELKKNCYSQTSMAHFCSINHGFKYSLPLQKNAMTNGARPDATGYFCLKKCDLMRLGPCLELPPISVFGIGASTCVCVWQLVCRLKISWSSLNSVGCEMR